MRGLIILEIAVAIATLMSAVFVGWQAMLLRASLETPYLANLQARQIDACASYTNAFAEFETTNLWMDGWGKIDGLPDLDGLTFRMPNLDDRLGPQDFGVPLQDTKFQAMASGVLTDFEKRAAEANSSLVGASEELAFFGGSPISEVIGQMAIGLTEMRAVDAASRFNLFFPTSNLSEDEVRERRQRLEGLQERRLNAWQRVKDANDQIARQCRLMMLGDYVSG